MTTQEPAMGVSEEDVRWLIEKMGHSPFAHDYVKDEKRCEICKRLAKITAALPHMQPADWPPCPECGAGVLFECPACSASNYPKQPAGEAVALLMRIRDVLFHADPGGLGHGFTDDGQPYSIRDQVMDAITRILTTPPQPSAEPQQEAQGAVGHVLRDVSQARMHVNLPEGTPLYAATQPAPVDVRLRKSTLRQAIHAMRRCQQESRSNWQEYIDDAERYLTLLSAQPSADAGDGDLLAAVRRMHAADEAYGLGFYDDPAWLDAYKETAAIAAQRGDR